jgi:hypothetical protein
MTNHLQTIRVRDGRLDPAEAEVWLFAYPERLTSTTRVSGRLVGPRCPYAGTVEVAYPFREQSREYESTGNAHIALRVIIPEPSFWDPESPFLYQGPADLWEGDQRGDQVQVSHGLRVLGLGTQGLRCNGRPLVLRGVARAACPEAEARSLHQAGCNTLLAPAGADAALWDLADRFGFLVLVRIADEEGLRAEALQAHTFRPHPCCLGWVVTAEVLAEGLAGIVAGTLPDTAGRAPLLGVELKQPPAGPLPEKVAFVVCPEALLPELTALDLPRVLLQDGAGVPPALAAPPPGVLGWVNVPPLQPPAAN